VYFRELARVNSSPRSTLRALRAYRIVNEILRTSQGNLVRAEADVLLVLVKCATVDRRDKMVNTSGARYASLINAEFDQFLRQRL
jgi:hypothetical protein